MQKFAVMQPQQIFTNLWLEDEREGRPEDEAPVGELADLLSDLAFEVTPAFDVKAGSKQVLVGHFLALTEANKSDLKRMARGLY